MIILLDDNSVKRAEINRQFQESWRGMLEELFPQGLPQTCRWVSLDSIVQVLNLVGSKQNANHMFFPDGGGVDLLGAIRSHELDAIELQAGFTTIVKPNELVFNSYHNCTPDWAYFRLECSGLQPSGVYEQNDSFISEWVTEVEHGQYVERSVWDAGFYGYDEDGLEVPLP